MDAIYHIATKEEFARLWQKNIHNNPSDPRWPQWARDYAAYVEKGMAVTFAAVLGGEPVGEATLLLSPACKAVGGCTRLADGQTVANVNALRMEKSWEGQGHMSRLVKELESYARAQGLRALTIGVDAWETRNLAIYLHWGYTTYVMAEEEAAGPVLYYQKML